MPWEEACLLPLRQGSLADCNIAYCQTFESVVRPVECEGPGRMTSLSLQSFDERHVRRLRRVRWLAAGIVCGVGVAIELVEDPTFDLDLFIELFVYILIIPALTWLAFTLVARLLAQRLKIDRSLNRYRQFIRELTHYQEWNEVVQYLVKLPGTLQSVKSAALLVYDHRHAQLRLASSWRSDHLTTYLPDRAPPLATCPACLSRHSSGVRASAVCLAVQNGLVDAHPDEYCLSLAHEGVLVGILKFRFRAGDKPNAETLDFLNAVAPDIALALALSAAHPAEVAQVRITAKVEERQQMAYELHDALAQQIAFLQLTLDHLARNHPSISPAELRKDLTGFRHGQGCLRSNPRPD